MTDWTIGSLAQAIKARKLSPVEAVQGYLDRIEKLNPKLRAFITVDAEGALARARALEKEPPARPAPRRAPRLQGSLRRAGPAHFVRHAHADYFPSALECTAVTRLSQAGAVTLGKLNMSELAMGPFGDNAHHGDAQNPWRVGHITGGSSQRIGRSGGGAPLRGRARQRHGRLDPAARGCVRDRGAQADLRPREPRRGDAAVVVLRPPGPDDADRA